jgi:hypothetical protein
MSIGVRRRVGCSLDIRQGCGCGSTAGSCFGYWRWTHDRSRGLGRSDSTDRSLLSFDLFLEHLGVGLCHGEIGPSNLESGEERVVRFENVGM